MAGRPMSILYDEIGKHYSDHRQSDPRIRQTILDALGGVESVANVGAGTGSYEPTSGRVIPIEPSEVMANQRPPGLTKAIIAAAEELPLADNSVDAALAILTIHHWSDWRLGLREMQRVARRRIVLLTIDPVVQREVWIFSEYFPEIAARDASRFPSLAVIRRTLRGTVSVTDVPIPADCRDGFLLTFWNEPEGLLDDRRRAATSGFASLDPEIERAGIERLRRDLEAGEWDARHEALRVLSEFDAGLRLVVSSR